MKGTKDVMLITKNQHHFIFLSTSKTLQIVYLYRHTLHGCCLTKTDYSAEDIDKQ